MRYFFAFAVTSRDFEDLAYSSVVFGAAPMWQN